VPVALDAQGQVDDAAHAAIQTDAWAARRWNWQVLGVPGLVEAPAANPAQTRAAAVADALRAEGITPVPVSADVPGRLELTVAKR
jgi:hypothetical protein